MRRFVEGMDRSQTTLFPESLDDWVDENNPVRVIDAFEADGIFWLDREPTFETNHFFRPVGSEGLSGQRFPRT